MLEYYKSLKIIMVASEQTANSKWLKFNKPTRP